MLQIPLSAVPSQTLSIVLDGQSCQIAVYQKQPITDEYGVAAGLFFDLIVNGVPVVNTVRCLDRTHCCSTGSILALRANLCFLIRPRRGRAADIQRCAAVLHRLRLAVRPTIPRG